MRRLILAVLMVLALAAFAANAFANPNGTINPLGTKVLAPYADIKPW